MFKQLNEEEFCERVYNLKDPGVLDYHGITPVVVAFIQPGTWTNQMVQHMQALAERYEGRMHFFTIDVNNEPTIAREVGIRAVPTTIFIPVGVGPKIVTGNIETETALDELIGKLIPMPLVPGINDGGLQPGQKLIIAH